MAEEERFLRLKDIELALPDHALQYCLREGGIGLGDVDCIAYAWNAQLYRGRILATNIRRWLTYHRWSDILKISLDEHRFNTLIAAAELVYHHPAVIRQRLRIRWGDLQLPPVHFVPHHLAHAASVFYCSGFDRAALLTMDRNGEDKCSVLWHADGLDLESLEEYRLPHSLGWFYAGFTDYLGFKPEYHEGKTMGLAAYGYPNDEIEQKLSRILNLEGRQAYSLDPTFFFYGSNDGNTYSKNLVQLFGAPRRSSNDEIRQEYKDIAYGVQAQLERAVLKLVQRVTERTGSRDLCITGGVGLNCVANGKVLQSGMVDRLYVSPVSNDAGSALGAALWIAKQAGYDPRCTMTHPYWGPGYSDDEICRALDRMGQVYERYDAVEHVVARDLAAGKTIGWFQGRMEIGPRALGARSLLGDPRTTAMRDRLNRIKGREPWRPLAPAILEGAAADYFEGVQPSPFMAIAFPVRVDKQAIIPAVVHVDGTTRPQTVGSDSNPRYLRLIRAFGELTGVPAIVNTSFNIDEPLVCSVVDAVRTFHASEMDELAIGPALLRKEHGSSITS
jgi:carbamoyltransferase